MVKNLLHFGISNLAEKRISDIPNKVKFKLTSVSCLVKTSGVKYRILWKRHETGSIVSGKSGLFLGCDLLVLSSARAQLFFLQLVCSSETIE